MASKAEANTSDRSLEIVGTMLYAAAKDIIIPGDRNQRIDQLKWRTIVSRIWKRLKVPQVEEATG
jgi:hypothetical protein